MTTPYCPQRGDVVWMSFTPQAGHEQAGHRPALALSPREYSQKVGLGLFCPITSQAKGYPFEVALPSHLPVSGVILSDHIKNLDWRARRATFICRLPSASLQEVTGKLLALIE
jgi:mRNA interferase MazF